MKILMSMVLLCGACFAENAFNPTFETIQVDNVINIRCEQDVVSFSSRFSNEYVQELKAQGYQGLKLLKDQQLDEWVKNQNYVEILKAIWAEPDIDFTIQTIEPLAVQGHAMMMYELSRIYSIKEDNTSAFKWFLLGMAHTDMDIACNEDRSTSAALDLLAYVYQPVQMQDRKEALKIFKSTMESWKFSDNLPSPQWVLYHGLGVFEGKNQMLPENLWKEKRQQILKNIIDVLDTI